MLRPKIIFSLCLMALAITLIPGTLWAEDWHIFKSESNLFQVRIPDNVQEKIQEFRIDGRRVAQVNQAVSTIDQRPFRETVKNYIIKYEQTLGLGVDDEDIAELITLELDLYSNHYKSLNGEQKSRKDLFFHKNVPAGEIHIAYEDPELGPQHIRARVLFTRSAKIQHIVSGPPEVINSIPTRKYFESLWTDAGFKRKDGSIRNDWQTIKSPLGVFTTYLPEKMNPYVPEDIKIKSSENIERISIQFYDPVLRQTMFYNIYGYKVANRPNDLNVENLTREKHVLRHLFDDKEVKFKQLTFKDMPILQTEYAIDPPENHPYVNFVKLRSEFANNHILVHEIIGPARLVKSNFIDNIVKSVELHR